MILYIVLTFGYKNIFMNAYEEEENINYPILFRTLKQQFSLKSKKKSYEYKKKKQFYQKKKKIKLI